jgi:crotonobetainyl-CoA hydratase
MSEESVLVEQRGQVMIAAINRPQAMNAINAEVSGLLGAALERAEHDSDVRCFILTGTGRSFCAGADLKAVGRSESIGAAGHDDWGFAGYVNHLISKPTIAAVNGFALGGGTELTLASDLAVATRSAVFGLPEVSRGVLAAAGGLIRLPRQVPRKLAMEMILTGDPITAEEALRRGLVNTVVDDEAVLDAAIDLAERICRNAPLSVQASKRIALGISDGRIVEEDAQWRLSETEVAKLMTSNDIREGMRAFAEKRAPNWTGS